MSVYEEERHTRVCAHRLGEVMELIIPNGKTVINKKNPEDISDSLELEPEKALRTSLANYV